MASGPVLLPTSSHPATDMSVPNGHVDDSLDDGREPSAQPQRSESDLSDLNDAPPAQTGPQEAHSDDDAIHDMATSEMDDDEDE
ncbi:hypothetical protein KC331_g20231, partial [Hortaea werneckii]